LLLGGIIGLQTLLILSVSLLTRLYAPEGFGLLAVYGALLGFISVVSSIRYEIAISLSESDAEAANLVIFSLLLVMLSISLSGLVGFSFALAPALPDYFWLLPSVFYSLGRTVFSIAEPI
jgi:O-antigen/teichoic acid export membrane protein